MTQKQHTAKPAYCIYSIPPCCNVSIDHVAKAAYCKRSIPNDANAAPRPTYDLWEPPFGGTPYTELT